MIMLRAWILKLPPQKQTKVCVDCYNKCFFCRRINRPPLFWMPPIKLLVISSFEYTTTIYHPFILDLIKGLDIVEQDNNSVFCVSSCDDACDTGVHQDDTDFDCDGGITRYEPSEALVTPVWLYNDNVSQWTLLCLVSYTFPLLYIRIHLNTSHSLLHSSRQHAFTTQSYHTILNYDSFHTIHWTTCRLYQATSEQCESGVFYETQLGETSCEMRHYIIGLTRSHDYHHLRQHHHYQTPCRHHQNSFLYSSYMISTRYYITMSKL